MDAQSLIAKRIALELRDGMLVNLGIGIPTLVANFIPASTHIFFQSENGLIGTGPVPEHGMAQPWLTDAAGRPVTALPGACTFDSAMSFALIRGGHVDVTVLGGLQVDQQGLLANWMIPGKMVPGMGGAMDLVTGANESSWPCSTRPRASPRSSSACRFRSPRCAGGPRRDGIGGDRLSRGPGDAPGNGSQRHRGAGARRDRGRTRRG